MNDRYSLTKGRVVYDRTTLLTAARALGDHSSADTARRLHISRATAWRLWAGTTAPSTPLAASVEEHYGVSAAQLLVKVAA